MDVSKTSKPYINTKQTARNVVCIIFVWNWRLIQYVFNAHSIYMFSDVSGDVMDTNWMYYCFNWFGDVLYYEI